MKNLPSNEALIWNTHGIFLVKNQDLKYTAINKSFANLIGFKAIDQAIGISDFDLPCTAAEFHAAFRSQDIMAMKLSQITTLDIMRYSDGKIWINLNNKAIIHDKNRTPS